MTLNDEKLKKLESLIQLVDESISKKEFVEVFEALVEFVKKAKKENSKEISDKVDVAIDGLNTTLDAQVRRVDNKLESVKDGEKGEKGERGERGVGERGEQGEQGIQGKDGKDADEQKVVTIVMETLWPQVEEGFKKLREEIREFRERRVGGGGTSAMGVQWAFGRIIKQETPSGAINGSNTAYTVTQDIHAVISFAINGQVITDDEYTISGRTITMDTAISTDLSGTSFRIVYV